MECVVCALPEIQTCQQRIDPQSTAKHVWSFLHLLLPSGELT